MRTDSLDVSSLVSYINDIKPFHSKLTTVVVEYQANDNVYASITDKSSMAMHLSSAWELQLVSDGARTQYRIPAAVFPRYSDDFHQCKRIGVTDEVPGVSGAYFVPYNNGVEVYVNGVKRSPTFDYTLNDDRSIVQFKQNLPKKNDEVCLNWSVVDRIFIRIGDESWSHFEIVYDSAMDGMEMFPYDVTKFDSDNNPILTGLLTDVKVDSIGRVRIINDNAGLPYYVFEFNTPPALDTKIWIRIEQREGYNGWTQTKIIERVTFKDIFRCKDKVNVNIADPGTWSRNTSLFGIDISSSRQGNYDIETFDSIEFDSIPNPTQIGYYTLFHINETLKNSFRATMSDKYSDRLNLVPKSSVTARVVDKNRINIKQSTKEMVSTLINEIDPGAFDESLFDTVVFDGNNPLRLQIKKSSGSVEKSTSKIAERLSIAITYTDGSTSINAIYSPDTNGVVIVNPAADSVEILHNYGFLPLVAIYENGQMLYPKTILYPSNNSIIVQFTQPRSVIIRLS